MADLAKCPFCGGNVEIYDSDDYFDTKQRCYAIRCNKCKLRASFADGNNRTLIINRWNKRESCPN